MISVIPLNSCTLCGSF